MIDLAIAYRVYPRVSPTPAAWGSDKLELSRHCLRSFKSALGSLRVKMWVLLDGCPPAYEELFRQYFSDEELEFVHLDGIGNHATFSMQVDLLTRQTDAELVFFAEDDYFYLPNALVTMIDFALSYSDVDFVTPYDHPDTYNAASHFERHRIRPFKSRYWRTSTSTCLTFLARRSALVRLREIFDSYRKGNNDGSLWLSITEKMGLLDLRVHFHDKARIKLWVKAWFWGFRQILFGRSYNLWNPLPSVATHMGLPFLAPTIDWYAEFDRADNGLVAPDGGLEFGYNDNVRHNKA
jgi:hypothetical protein